MAYAHDTHHAATGLSLAERIGQLRADLATRIARYRLYRETLAELSTLGPRELHDLGLNTADLPALARSAAYGA
ncbi:DUF1127 domain-containing protein [Rubellimicrobium roseum]|uniref:DUF1127 domain-containing protein n=1 Tax=Rubellimicrobium roseum TaxID=687525 RepID=A0A5C4NIF7_9RHOB|nr:DUF1127 domain-containing protein [Rubellimicrobium roseum]TNC73720.1 DUF1127 domain-containing protein [Rubellimicrobium roseum]